LKLRVEVGELLLERLDVLVGAGDVLRFLHRAPDAARGRAGAANVADARLLAAEDGTKDRRAEADRGAHLRRARLLALHLFRLLGAADAVLKRGQLRRVLLTEFLHVRVALLARGLLEARAEVALGFTGARRLLEARAAPEL
jgi:hypothetical protein